MRDATLCLLIEDNRILLGYKKVGFGQGKYGGFGGKVEPGESIAAAAARELEEESGLRVPVERLELAGHLTFLFPHRPEWSQVVHVYRVVAWEGEAVESREMRPAWFPWEAIPYGQMWQDGRYWLPPILDGQRVRAVFSFQADNETIEEFAFQPWVEGTPVPGEG
jgi:8-oxo-dGTP diphosphatase